MVRRFLVVSLAGLLFFACSKENNVSQDKVTNIGPGNTGSGDAGSECKDVRECASGVCLRGLCRQTCTESSGCGAGNRCLHDTNSKQSGCSLPADDGCQADADCGDFRCFEGKCRSRCIDGVACAQGGQYCVEGMCFDKGEAGKVAEAIQCIEEKRPALFCDGATLTGCNVPKKPGRESLATCDTPALCAAAAAAGASTCQPAACQEGEQRCHPVTFQPEACNADRTGFVAIAGAKACASLGLCQLVLAPPVPEAPVTQAQIDAVKQDCQASSICQRGVCFDGNPYVCNADRSSLDVQQECGAQQCDPTAGACVTLQVDEREVSRAKYADFLKKIPPAVPAACQWNTSYQPFDDASWTAGDEAEQALPVVGVDWCDAYAYCAAQGQRLCGKLGKDETVIIKGDVSAASDPGQSEWMNACSAGGELEFAYGAAYKSQNCRDSNSSGGAPTGVDELALTCSSARPAYKKLHNLLGNVAEWENACDRAVSVGSADDACLARGGDYTTSFNSLGCSLGATKESAQPLKRTTKNDRIGFRCCG